MLFHRSGLVKFVSRTLLLIFCFLSPHTMAAPPPDKEVKPGNMTPLAKDGLLRVRARAALLINMQSGEVLYQKNSLSQVPIASLTKLMTAVTFMGLNPDLDERVTIVRRDVYRANWTWLRNREKVYVRDLLYAALISSDNAAARALARVTGLSRKDFVERMNQTAETLGLAGSKFTEPTGLDAGNMSTAIDCANLLWAALQNDTIAEILATREYKFKTNRRYYTIRTTNQLLRFDDPDLWEIKGGKTGYIRKAGYCLVTRARNQSGDDVMAVVLGGLSSRTRFADMRRLLHWGFQNLEKQERLGG